MTKEEFRKFLIEKKIFRVQVMITNYGGKDILFVLINDECESEAKEYEFLLWNGVIMDVFRDRDMKFHEKEKATGKRNTYTLQELVVKGYEE